MNFNYDTRYKINLNDIERNVITNLLSAFTYTRLYKDYSCFKEDIKEQDKDMRGTGQKLHFADKLNRLSREDNITDDLVKNQLALGLILENFMNRKENDFIELNAMLAYEFYISIAEAIERNKDMINEEISIQDANYSEKKLAQEKAKKDNIILKDLNKKIVALVGLKQIYIIKLDYAILTISEHKEACLK